MKPVLLLLRYLLSVSLLSLLTLPLHSQEGGSLVGSRIALLEAEFLSEYEQLVERVFKDNERELDLKYYQALDRILDLAVKAARLEEAIAIREEKKRIDEATGVPTVDSPTDPESLKQVRATYRIQRQKLEAERDLTAGPVFANHDENLAAYQTLLTTEGKLDDALKVKEARGNAAAVLERRQDSKVGSSVSFTEWLATVKFENLPAKRTYSLDGENWLVYQHETGQSYRYPVVRLDENTRTIVWRFGDGTQRTLTVDEGMKIAFQDDLSRFSVIPQAGVGGAQPMSTTPASPTTTTPASSSADKGEGWHEIFNGRDLSSWKPMRTSRSFQVADGVLSAKRESKEPDYLIFEGNVAVPEVLRNFEMEITIKSDSEANSGVYFHLVGRTEDRNGNPENGLELSLIKRKGAIQFPTGAIHGEGPQRAFDVNQADWFDLRFRVEGQKVTVWINGTMYYERTVPLASSTKSFGIQPDGGRIAIQALSTEGAYHFKRIAVRVLE